MSNVRNKAVAETGSLKSALVNRQAKRRASLQAVSKAGGRSTTVRNDLLPELRLGTRAVVSLSLPRRNIRKLDVAHTRDVASSIQALGFTVPIVVDPDGVVVDGIVRLEAAKLLGMREVPCLVVPHRLAQERRLLRLALNRLQEQGQWDLEALKLEFEELIIDYAPIEITGFSTSEVDQILLDDAAAETEVGPLEPDADAAAVTKPGDLFEIGPHRLICGDARDPAVLARLMRDDKAAFVFTDQPYNVPIRGHVTGGNHREFAMASGEMTTVEFEAFTVDWMRAALNHLRDGGCLATFIDWRGLETVQAAAGQHLLRQLNLIVWAKSAAGMGSLYRSQHELLPLYSFGKTPHINNVELGRHGRWRSNVWTYPGATSFGSDARQGLKDHPTVKPVAMLVDAIFDLTDRGDLILDPFAGSGSTLLAAEKAGRIAFCVELDPRYCDLMLARHAATHPKGPKPRLANG